jgi:hypothetical protein
VLFRPVRRPSFAGVLHAAVLGEGVLLLGGYAALAGATLSGVWHVIGLSAAVRALCGMPRVRAAAAVLVAWSVAACGNAAVLVALMDRFPLLR